jgi:hypothetical protein
MTITLFVPELQVLHLVHGVWSCDNGTMKCLPAFCAANPPCELMRVLPAIAMVAYFALTTILPVWTTEI